jgi:UDP-N-acetylmuramoylalanine--D-glutamate ligase
MELSSFQLEYFHPQLNKYADVPAQAAGLLAGWSPPIAAMLNITPNHLDRHPSMKHYVQAKRSIVDYQQPTAAMVMGLDNDMTRTIGHQFGSRVRWFSLEAQPPGGAGLHHTALAFFNADGQPKPIVETAQVKLRGKHNLANILAASLLAREAGAPIDAMQQVATGFTGVPHRLQLVRELNGVSYFNDSIATSPERVMAALRSFSEPIVLLAGGKDKLLPWDEAARQMLKTTRQIILYGQAAQLIHDALNRAAAKLKHGQPPQVHRCETLDEAVLHAAKMARPGDAVLLSPGCASFDQFSGYTERGDRFVAVVNEL